MYFLYSDFKEIINEAKADSDILDYYFFSKLAHLFISQNISDPWFFILRYNIYHLNAAAIFLSGINLEFGIKSQDITDEQLFKTFCLLGESKEIHSIKSSRDKNNEPKLIKELRTRSTPYHNHQLFCQETKQTPVNFDQFRISAKISMPVLLLQFNSFLTHKGTRKEINPTELTFLVASYLIGPMPYEEYSFFRSRHMEIRKKTKLLRDNTNNADNEKNSKITCG